jgi:hypothetical protein
MTLGRQTRYAVTLGCNNPSRLSTFDPKLY